MLVEAKIAEANNLPVVLIGAWTSAEYPERPVGRRTWVNLFRLAAYPPHSETIAIYRGAPSPSARGMAWTTDSVKTARQGDRPSLACACPTDERGSIPARARCGRTDYPWRLHFSCSASATMMPSGPRT
jgi:hypothetical protein